MCVSCQQGRQRADGIQTVVTLATPSFSESLIQRNADGSLPPQTPELLAKMVPPMFAALQHALGPLLVENQGRLHEPAFVQVSPLPCAAVITAEAHAATAVSSFGLQSVMLAFSLGANGLFQDSADAHCGGLSSVRHATRSPRHCEVGRRGAVAAAQLPCQRPRHCC
jgi:hypothetical protein